MSKSLRYILIVAAAAVTLFALILATIAFTVDPNRFKPEIVRLVQEKKQRTLSIEGDIRLRLFPKLGIELGRTRLSERQGTAEFASVDGVRLSVAWLPLLRRELVVDRIAVKGARAHLVRHADGTTNFDDLLSKEESPQVKFDVEGLELTGGTLDFDDRMAGRRLNVSGLTLETGRLRDDTPTRVEAAFRLAVSQPRIATEIQLKSGLRFALESKHHVLTGLDLRVTGEAAGVSDLDLSARGNVELQLPTPDRPQAMSLEAFALSLKGRRGAERLEVALDAPRLALAGDKAEARNISVDGKLEQPRGLVTAHLAVPDLSGNAQAFRVSRIAFALDGRQGDGRFSGRLESPLNGSLETLALELPRLAAQFRLNAPGLAQEGVKLDLAGRASMNLKEKRAGAELDGRLNDGALTARLEVASFDPLRLGFGVSLDRLDVDRLLGEKPKGAPPGPEKPIDLSALKMLDARGSVRIGELKMAGIRASDVRLELKAGGGRVTIDPAAANLYHGSLRGSVSATASANPHIALRQRLTGIRIGPLIQDFSGKDLLDGHGDLAFDVTTQGATVSALKKALGGTASLRLADGAIKGVNVAALLRRARAALSGGLFTQAAAETERTDFTELSASFRIANGVAHNEDLSVKSPLLRLAGSGDIDIAQGSMDYVLKAAVVGTLEGQGGRELAELRGITVPVRVRGPFDRLSYSVDPQALISESAKARIEQKKEAVKEKVREELFRGLFGR